MKSWIYSAFFCMMVFVNSNVFLDFSVLKLFLSNRYFVRSVGYAVNL